MPFRWNSIIQAFFKSGLFEKILVLHVLAFDDLNEVGLSFLRMQPIYQYLGQGGTVFTTLGREKKKV